MKEPPRRPWLFPWTRAPRLESKDRGALLPWDRITHALRPGPGMSYADLGAGPGVFTRKLLEITQGEGRFFAVEAQAAMLAVLKRRTQEWQRAGLRGAHRVSALLSSGSSIPLDKASVDRALLIHLLHEVSDPAAYLRELRGVLRPWGRALIVDWATAADPGRQTQMGPPLWSRISEEEALRASKAAGFGKVERIPGFPHGWALLLA